jgi:hypothetical protein
MEPGAVRLCAAPRAPCRGARGPVPANVQEIVYRDDKVIAIRDRFPKVYARRPRSHAVHGPHTPHPRAQDRLAREPAAR